VVPPPPLLLHQLAQHFSQRKGICQRFALLSKSFCPTTSRSGRTRQSALTPLCYLAPLLCRALSCCGSLPAVTLPGHHCGDTSPPTSSELHLAPPPPAKLLMDVSDGVTPDDDDDLTPHDDAGDDDTEVLVVVDLTEHDHKGTSPKKIPLSSSSPAPRLDSPAPSPSVAVDSATSARAVEDGGSLVTTTGEAFIEEVEAPVVESLERHVSTAAAGPLEGGAGAAAAEVMDAKSLKAAALQLRKEIPGWMHSNARRLASPSRRVVRLGSSIPLQTGTHHQAWHPAPAAREAAVVAAAVGGNAWGKSAWGSSGGSLIERMRAEAQ